MKSSSKIDGVIEAVRYAHDGRIAQVRVYERRGATFGDRTLLTRQQLIERLKAGKHFIVGRRKEFWGTTFETGPEVHLVQDGGSDWVRLAQASGNGDTLPGVPLF